MINLIDILYSLINNIESIYPNYNNYVGNLPEKASYPCFLYTIGFNKHKINSYYTQKVLLNVDIVYFNTRDAYNTEDYIEKLDVINSLEEGFLSKYYLDVNKRKLTFNYDLDESDGQMLINLKFDFFDVNNTKTIEKIYDEIEEIYIKFNGKELI